MQNHSSSGLQEEKEGIGDAMVGKCLVLLGLPKSRSVSGVRSVFSSFLSQGKGSAAHERWSHTELCENLELFKSHSRQQKRKSTTKPRSQQGCSKYPKWDTSKIIAWAAFPAYRHKRGISLSYSNLNINEEPPWEASKMKRDSFSSWHKKNQRQRIN